MYVMVMSVSMVTADALCLQFIVWAAASATLHHATVLQTSSAADQLSEDSQCTFQSLGEYFVNMCAADLASSFSVCVCVRKWARHGYQTAMVGSQLLKPGSTRSSLLPLSFGREYKTETEAVTASKSWSWLRNRQFDRY